MNKMTTSNKEDEDIIPKQITQKIEDLSTIICQYALIVVRREDTPTRATNVI
jgi:hypothetical protein